MTDELNDLLTRLYADPDVQGVSKWDYPVGVQAEVRPPDPLWESSVVQLRIQHGGNWKAWILAVAGPQLRRVGIRYHDYRGEGSSPLEALKEAAAKFDADRPKRESERKS